VLAIAVEDIIRPEYIAEQRWDLITEAAKNVLRLINAPN
jgi:hypothetical protein